MSQGKQAGSFWKIQHLKRPKINVDARSIIIGLRRQGRALSLITRFRKTPVPGHRPTIHYCTPPLALRQSSSMMWLMLVGFLYYEMCPGLSAPLTCSGDQGWERNGHLLHLKY